MRTSPWAVGIMGVLTAGAAGCGPTSSSSDVDAARPDIMEGPPSCSSSGVVRPLVVGINGDTDIIKVFGLDGGVLVDANIEFPAENPDDVAIRSDGREALVSFGQFDQNYGVYVLDLANGGQTASIKQTLNIGMSRVPWGIAYADDDHAVFATAAGFTGHTLTALDRTDTGDWAAGPTSPVPDEWPLQLAKRPGASEVLLARTDLSMDPGTDFYRLQRNGSGAWAPAGTSANVLDNPLDMAVSPNGGTLYTATADPNDKVSSTNLDGKGLVHAIPITSSGLGTAMTTSIIAPGSQIAADPKGGFLVVDTPVIEADPNTGNPSSHFHRLVTVPLASESFSTPLVESTMTPTLLLYGLEVAPNGLVIRSRQLYASQAPDAEATPIEILLPKGDGDFETCATRFLPGQGRFAIGP
jgi:hypothetical protein